MKGQELSKQDAPPDDADHTHPSDSPDPRESQLSNEAETEIDTTNRPSSGLSPADTASGDVTAPGGPRFDRDLSENPPARRAKALTAAHEPLKQSKPR